MEKINDEILSGMMIDHQEIANEFFPLSALFPQLENALMDVSVQVNKLFMFEIKNIYCVCL